MSAFPMTDSGVSIVMTRAGARCDGIICCLLPAACCLLPAACCLLPAACCLLPAGAHRVV
ncbi:hypothetical protein [Nocardia colli]|uniref:hypothetical protein n=1 Tax=Nocardia colli TaxID=2545717 RepID=UPI0035DE5472